jgi:transcriptional regulator with XRE-family HTH domain
MCKFALQVCPMLPTVTTMSPSRRLNGAAVKAIRESLGINASTIAKDIGVSRGYYSRLESGDRSGTPQTMKAIADRLKVQLDAVTIKGDDEAAA